jgi:hypothetical protein
MKRSLFEMNKTFPARYKALMLGVLEQFPDLQTTHIRFEIKKHYPVPYGTRPKLSAVFRKPEKRVYIVTILEQAKPPVEHVLFDRLTDEMRRGVIAHELMHVVQFQSKRTRKEFFLFLLSFRRKHRAIERAADKGAIERGYGDGLREHALFIRQVPGYVEQRPGIETDYMHPDEILAYQRSLSQ